MRGIDSSICDFKEMHYFIQLTGIRAPLIPGTYDTPLVTTRRTKTAQQTVTKLQDTIQESLRGITIVRRFPCNHTRSTYMLREHAAVTLGNPPANFRVRDSKRKLNNDKVISNQNPYPSFTSLAFVIR